LCPSICGFVHGFDGEPNSGLTPRFKRNLRKVPRLRLPRSRGVKSTVDHCSKLIRVKSRLDPISFLDLHLQKLFLIVCEGKTFYYFSMNKPNVELRRGKCASIFPSILNDLLGKFFIYLEPNQSETE